MKEKINVIELKDFERKDEYAIYAKREHPFIDFVTEIDITNIVKTAKKQGNFYALMNFVVMLAINKIKNFKYRTENGKIVWCEKIVPSITDLNDKKKLMFFDVEYTENYQDFLANYLKSREKANKVKVLKSNDTPKHYWVSCLPWLNFSAMSLPYNKNGSTPQIIWGKYNKQGRKYKINLFISVLHAFVDGQHIAEFINNLSEINGNLKQYL